VAPALMQEVGRKAAAVFLQLEGARLARREDREHADFAGQMVALQEIAAAAGGNDIGPGGAAAARARDHVVEGEVLGREIVAAILADETIAQENIEPGEGRAAR